MTSDKQSEEKKINSYLSFQLQINASKNTIFTGSEIIPLWIKTDTQRNICDSAPKQHLLKPCGIFLCFTSHQLLPCQIGSLPQPMSSFQSCDTLRQNIYRSSIYTFHRERLCILSILVTLNTDGKICQNSPRINFIYHQNEDHIWLFLIQSKTHLNKSIGLQSNEPYYLCMSPIFHTSPFDV